MVATAVDSVIKRDPGSGKFVKGNASGKLAKGVPKNGKPILTAQQLRLSEACKAIRDAAPDIVNKQWSRH